jgi:hypothetical protein
MPRVSDVDTVAPDDPVIFSSPPQTDKDTTPKIVPSKTDAEYDQRINDILGHTKSPFSSFLVHPKVFNFEERDDDENILLVLRPHWFTNLSWVLITIIMIFVPLTLAYVPLLASFAPNYRFVAVLFWYLITFIYAFEKFLSWYFDVFIVTDRRVIDIDFENLIVKKFSEADIHVIQDVTSSVIGLFPTMLNYGMVLIQTAAEIPEITFENVPNPEKVIKVLQELREKDHHA